MASCSNAYKPFDKGSPATVVDATFSGALNNISLEGKGWTEEQVSQMVTTNPFKLEIQNNEVYTGMTMRPQQLLCPDTSNPNVVEASSEQVLEDGTTYTEYIKITLDDASNPTTAKVEYTLKFYSPEYASHPGLSDIFTAKYEGDLTKQ